MRSFSRDNTIRPEKRIKSMNHREFYDYARRKITEELWLCQNRLSNYTYELSRINNERTEYEEKANSLPLNNDYENIKQVMRCILPGRNVTEDTMKTEFGKKHKAAQDSLEARLRTISQRRNAVNSQIVTAENDVEYWQQQLKKYNTSNVPRPNEPLSYNFFTFFLKMLFNLDLVQYNTKHQLNYRQNRRNMV